MSTNVATITGPSGEPIELQVDAKKWAQFLAAAEALDTSPEKLLAEAIDLCGDTAIALAVAKQRNESA
jgi:hypothetical protein